MTQATALWDTLSRSPPGLGRLSNKHFRGASGLVKIAKRYTLALLAVSCVT